MRAVQSNIGLNVVGDPDKLAAMHVAYRLITAPETGIRRRNMLSTVLASNRPWRSWASRNFETEGNIGSLRAPHVSAGESEDFPEDSKNLEAALAL